MYIITGSLTALPHNTTVQLGLIPHGAALAALPTFTSSNPSGVTGISSSTTSAVMSMITPSTPLASIIQPIPNPSAEAVSVGPSSPLIPLKIAQKI